MAIHHFLDWEYGGEDALRELLAQGADVNEVAGPYGETPLHVAARRRRAGAITILIQNGADMDAKNGGGKTAYAHAIRRTFTDIAKILADAGASIQLNEADRFAVALTHGRLDEAREILSANPGVARTGNPEEDRLLADVAGRNAGEPVELLIEAGADLAARGVDDGTPLHITAWFGQPENARLLIEAGAPLEIFDRVHESSPIGWAAHGSRYSGGADERQDVYVAVTRHLLHAGCALHYPGDESSDYLERLLKDASTGVADILRAEAARRAS